jgi:hypothetical protein
MPDPQKPRQVYDDQGRKVYGDDGKPLLDTAAKPDPTGGRSVASRGVGGFLTGSGLNPIPIVQAMEQEASDPGGGVTLPVRMLLSALSPVWGLPKAWESFKAGRYTDAANQASASIPMIGPAAQHASERWKSGDVAGGVGEVAGLATMPFLPGAAAAGTARVAPAVARAAGRGSVSRIVEMIAPKAGANKVRFGNNATEVAPRLAREPGMGAWSAEGLANNIDERAATAGAGLDAASDARNAGHVYPTADIQADLSLARGNLTARAVEGSLPERVASSRTSAILNEHGQPITVQELQRAPMGQDVVPAPNRARVAPIDQAAEEIAQLGPEARYESLRRIRGAYDGPARLRYNPSMTADFLAKTGESAGAADVTHALRTRMAGFDPETAVANAEYSFWKKANDVAAARAETERVRPNRLNPMIARAAGAAAGATSGGLGGAAIGTGTAEVLTRAANTGFTPKIQMARLLAQIEDAAPGLPTAIAAVTRAQILSARLAADRKD